MKELLEKILAEIKKTPGGMTAYEDLYHICIETKKTDAGLAVKYLKLLSDCIERQIPAVDSDRDLHFLFNLHKKVLLAAAPLDFESYLLYVEWNREPEKKFYVPRREVLRPIVQAMQDMIDDKIDLLTISMPPGTGKSTLGIFFLSWVMGKYPDGQNLASAHSGMLTRSFYDGVYQIITDIEYLWSDVFPGVQVATTNSKEETIDLNKKHRFSTLTCRAINASLTGATRCDKILYADDLCSGIEEAMSKERLDKLWAAYTNDLKSRKKMGAKEIHIATRWSVHDVIGRLEQQYGGDSRARFIVLPALNEEGESNFNYGYNVGFDKKYFEDMRLNLDEASFKALFMNQPIEREGLLYDVDELRRYFELPIDPPDAIIGVCDTKDKGTDYACLPVAYVYGNDYYIDDVVCDNTATDWWDKAKSWWSDATKDGLSLETGVELVKKGWTTVKGWIGNIPTVSQMVGLLKSGWSTVKDWVGNIPIVNQAVSLVKSGWSTVKGWIGNIPGVSQAVSLAKSGWNTVKEWIGNIPTLSQAISLLKSGWTTVKNWIGNIPIISQGINLIKSGWTTVKNWIGNIPTLSQAISLIKSGWTTVKGWTGNIPTLSQAISLIKSGWSTVKNWIGNIPVLSQGISLLKSGWSTVKSWIGSLPVISQGISLIKSGWSTVKKWINTSVVSVGISLFKSGWSSLSSWIGTKVSVGISLFKSGWSSIKSFFGLSSGGYNTGHGWKFFEQGGYMKNGRSEFWKNIPMYANGTTNAGLHGSMFVAGENGAEMVGHINGQTEVLNRSQIAMAMKSATIAGMSQFVGYWRSMVGQMTVCTNAIIRAVLVSSDMTQVAFATAGSYDPTNYLSQSVYEDSQRGYNNSFSDESLSRTMREFYREYVEPTLKEIASDTKRQADKEEQTIVQVGNRTITDAVETQQRANGYKFTK